MQYTVTYDSPLGEILLACDESGMTGLWFAGQKYFGSTLVKEPETRETPLLQEAKVWLDAYFAGKNPVMDLPCHPIGTPFHLKVSDLLRQIPYGKTISYGELAEELARQEGLSHMSAQAVGGAVARNEISILIPCHRVVGKNGSLTGYAGGVEKKAALLRLEGAWSDRFFYPEKRNVSKKHG